MRNLFPILFAVFVLSSGCDPDGYSCNSEGCYEDNDAQYLTLEDCLSVCDGNSGNIFWKGYSYSTVQIGEQLWFSENCRYLPSVSPSATNSYTEPYCYVYDYEGVVAPFAKLEANYSTYGVLYNWPAVMTEDICPSGWHIPTDEDWAQLTDYLGGEEVAGGEMKESGYDHWSSSNTGGTNSSGFTGLPAGYTDGTGFYGKSDVAVWWSSSATASNESAWKRNVYSNSKELIRKDHPGNYGFSARCIRD